MLKHGKWTLAIMATGLALGLAVAGTSLAKKEGNGGGKPGGGDPPPDLPTYSIEMLGTLGASSNDFSVARGMNNLGDVVGLSSYGSRVRAFLHTAEFGMQDLNHLIYPNSNSGRLQSPRDLTWGPDGNLYVVSALNNSVVQYDGDTGEFLSVFVSPGSGGLDFPGGLTFGPLGDLYVSSRRTNQVLRYYGPLSTDGLPGHWREEFVGDDPITTNVDESGGLVNPNGIVFDTDGNLYVASRSTDQILRYDASSGAPSVFVAQVTGELGPTIADIEFGPADGHLYVASTATDAVLRFWGPLVTPQNNESPGDPLPGPNATDETAEFVASGSGGLDAARDLVFGPNGDLYVTSGLTHEILRYNGATGEPVGTGEFVSAGSGGLDDPFGLLFDNVFVDGNLVSSRLLVTSRDTHEILVYEGPTSDDSSLGTFIAPFSPEPEWVLEEALDINDAAIYDDSGQIVGYGQIVGHGYFKGDFRAFRLTLGGDPAYVIENLETLGDPSSGPSSGSSANGINDAGDVTGSSGSPDGVTHAFVFLNDDQMVEIAGLSDGNSYGNSINESGQITGESGEGAFRYTPGVGVELLASKKKVINVGVHINDSGQVAGQIDPGRRWSHHAARFTDGVGVEDLGTLGGEGTDEAGGINNSGDVVGWSTTAEPTRHAFLYTDATGMIDLEVAVDPPDGYQYFGMLRPKKINDPGQICGSTSNEYDLPVRAFLLTPL